MAFVFFQMDPSLAIADPVIYSKQTDIQHTFPQPKLHRISIALLQKALGFGEGLSVTKQLHIDFKFRRCFMLKKETI